MASKMVYGPPRSKRRRRGGRRTIVDDDEEVSSECLSQSRTPVSRGDLPEQERPRTIRDASTPRERRAPSDAIEDVPSRHRQPSLSRQQVFRSVDLDNLSRSPPGLENFAVRPGPPNASRHPRNDAKPVEPHEESVPWTPQSVIRQVPGVVVGSTNQSTTRPSARHLPDQASAQSISGHDSGRSLLSPRAREFAQIKVGGYQECKDFILKYPHVLCENENLFLQEAVQAYERGDLHRSRSAIQQALLVRECHDLDLKDTESYIEDLVEGHKTTRRSFIKDFDRTLDVVKEKAAAIAAATAARVPKSAPSARAGAGRHSMYNTTTGTSMTGEMTMQSRSRNVEHARPNMIADQLAGMNIADHSRQNFPPRETLAYQSAAAPPARDRHGVAATRSVDSQSDVLSQHSRLSVLPGDYDIRGTAGEVEPLDSRYQQRRDAANFFKVGRVFAILWHENMGTSKNPTKGSDVKHVNPGPYGEQIFSHIRRMIVVRQRYGYCWCITINSYSSKGIAKKRQSEDEKRAHTIVHDSTLAAQRFRNEEGMTKDPIAVDMAQGQTLESSSRLNFAKVYTVEHNVKVMNVGRVASSSMVNLRTYWRDETSD